MRFHCRIDRQIGHREDTARNRFCGRFVVLQQWQRTGQQKRQRAGRSWSAASGYIIVRWPDLKRRATTRRVIQLNWWVLVAPTTITIHRLIMEIRRRRYKKTGFQEMTTSRATGAGCRPARHNNNIRLTSSLNGLLTLTVSQWRHSFKVFLTPRRMFPGASVRAFIVVRRAPKNVFIMLCRGWTALCDIIIIILCIRKRALSGDQSRPTFLIESVNCCIFLYSMGTI